MGVKLRCEEPTFLNCLHQILKRLLKTRDDFLAELACDVVTRRSEGITFIWLESLTEGEVRVCKSVTMC